MPHNGIQTFAPMKHWSYLSLHHVGSMESQVKHGAVDIHRVFGVQLLQHSIQDNESPRPAHTGADKKTKVQSKNTLYTDHS